MPPATLPKAPARRLRAALAGLLAAGILGLVLLRANRGFAPPPPIPAPAGLASLDPQVRDHLAGLARQAADRPRDPARRAELGLAFAVNDLWREARQCFLDALSLGDAQPLTRVYLAAAEQEGGDPAAALRTLERLVGEEPGFAPAWHRLGLAHLARGDARAAAAAFTEVTRLSPGSWHGWAGLGEARLRLQQPDAAAGSLQEALRRDPGARPAHHLLGQAWRALGRTQEAAAALRAGRGETIPPLPDAWTERAFGHMRLLPDQFDRAGEWIARGDPGQAIRLLQPALQYHPTNAAVAVRLAEALTAADQAAEARRLLAPFLESQPQSLPLLTAAAHAAAAAGQSEEAATLATRAVDLNPARPESHVALADARLAAGRDREAAELLARAVTLAPDNPALLLQLGDLLHHNLQDSAAALTRYEQALALDPLHPPTLERVAGGRLELGQTDGVAALIDRHLALVGPGPVADQLRQRLAETVPAAPPAP